MIKHLEDTTLKRVLKLIIKSFAVTVNKRVDITKKWVVSE